MMTNNLALRDLDRNEMMEVNGGEPVSAIILIAYGLGVLTGIAVGWRLARRFRK